MPLRIEDLALNDATDAAPDDVLFTLTGPSFDPVSFLNNNLPPLNIPTAQPSGVKGAKATQIQDASTQLQGLLTKVNMQNIRSSSNLTHLTDEILRSGSRLAYEVEVLRGDANGLYEILTDNLQEDIRHFVSEQLLTTARTNDEIENGEDASQSPEFIAQLRMLGQVKARLEAVIKVFGDAMKWPLPASEVSMTSSLISVSAPELGIQDSDQDEKAREIARKYRIEITNILDSDGGGYGGLEAGTAKVENLRLLASIWKGTAEEKARIKFVDSLSKLVEERRKSLDARALPQRSKADSSAQRSGGRPFGRTDRTAAIESNNPAAGLFRNLQKLRDEIYLD